MAVTDRYQKGHTYLYTLGADPDKLPEMLGINARRIRATDFPHVDPRFELGDAGVVAGAARSHSPRRSLSRKPNTPWVKICDEDDKVTRFAVAAMTFIFVPTASPRHEVVELPETRYCERGIRHTRRRLVLEIWSSRGMRFTSNIAMAR